jgi:hypothetical protein
LRLVASRSASRYWLAFMLPIVFWNIFAMCVTNPLFANFAIVYFVALSFVFADSFAVFLWNHSATFYFIVTRNFSVAFLFARNSFLAATFCCIIAWLIMYV